MVICFCGLVLLQKVHVPCQNLSAYFQATIGLTALSSQEAVRSLQFLGKKSHG